MKTRGIRRIWLGLALAVAGFAANSVRTAPQSEAHTCVNAAVYTPVTVSPNPGCSDGHAAHTMCRYETVKVDGIDRAAVAVCVSL